MNVFQELLEHRAYAGGVLPDTKTNLVLDLVRRSLIAHNHSFANQTLEDIHHAVMRREELGSTGIGQGVAIPHAKSQLIERPLLFFARTAEPCDFDALDGDPVDLLILLLSPSDQRSTHLKHLEDASRSMRDDEFRTSLRRARNELEFGSHLRKGFEDMEFVETEQLKSKANVHLQFAIPADTSDDELQQIILNSVRTLNENYRNVGGAGFSIEDFRIEEPSMIPSGVS